MTSGEHKIYTVKEQTQDHPAASRMASDLSSPGRKKSFKGFLYADYKLPSLWSSETCMYLQLDTQQGIFCAHIFLSR